MTAADAEFWELWGEWGQAADGTPLPLLLQRLKGRGADGDVWEPEESLPGLPQTHKPRLVRNTDGDEITSNTRILAPLSYADRFVLGARVKPAHEGWTPIAAVTVTDDGVLPAVAVDLG